MAACALVFDWDNSFVGDNTDTWVPAALAPDIVETIGKRAAAGEQWTDLMDNIMGELAERGFGKEDVITALVSIPTFYELPVIARLASLHRDVAAHVVSDANQVFIESILAARGINIPSVVTNPSAFDAEGRLHIRRWHARDLPPHGCPRCPLNMCKGLAMDGLRLSVAPSAVSAAAANGAAAEARPNPERSAKRVLYVGDGSGDLCAILRLGEGDVACAREGFPLLKRLRSSDVAPLVRAKVVPWSTGADVLAAALEFLHEAAPLPMADGQSVYEASLGPLMEAERKISASLGSAPEAPPSSPAIDYGWM